MKASEKMKGYTKIVVLASIGNDMVELVSSKEGHDFSKYALEVYWYWIEGDMEVLGDMYCCLDSPEGIDFVYYEEIEKEEEQQLLYETLFNILGCILDEIATMEKMGTPQYLDMVTHEFFDSLIISLIEKYPYLEELINKVFDYCKKTILNDDVIETQDFCITQEAIKKLLGKN